MTPVGILIHWLLPFVKERGTARDAGERIERRRREADEGKVLLSLCASLMRISLSSLAHRTREREREE